MIFRPWYWFCHRNAAKRDDQVCILALSPCCQNLHPISGRLFSIAGDQHRINTPQITANQLYAWHIGCKFYSLRPPSCSRFTKTLHAHHIYLSRLVSQNRDNEDVESRLRQHIAKSVGLEDSDGEVSLQLWAPQVLLECRTVLSESTAQRPDYVFGTLPSQTKSTIPWP